MRVHLTTRGGRRKRGTLIPEVLESVLKMIRRDPHIFKRDFSNNLRLNGKLLRNLQGLLRDMKTSHIPFRLTRPELRPNGWLIRVIFSFKPYSRVTEL